MSEPAVVVAAAAGSYEGLLSAIIASFALIVVSEIGDKTFFIAALMAMKENASLVLLGAISALVLMTILSAFLGHMLPLILDPYYTHVASVILFFVFGIKLLYDGWTMESSVGEELKAVEQELSTMISSTPKARALSDSDLEKSPVATKRGGSSLGLLRQIANVLKSGTFLKAFSLTCAAEWGDRSQISTIAMGAAKDVCGVTIGAIVGHAMCSFMAVAGGKALASRISEKWITLIGGSTFLLFSLGGLLVGM